MKGTEMSQVLMVVTAADSLTLADGSSHPTGFWAEELVELHRGLIAAGHTVRFATPGGRPAPVDPGSLDLTTPEGAAVGNYLNSLAPELASPSALADIAVGDDDAIALPGGHGPMADLAFDRDLGRLLIASAEAATPVAVLCHGPAGLLSAVRGDGSFAFAGSRLAVFTDEEELAGGLGANSPYLVASRLSGLGAVLATGAPWSSTVVTDGALVSGQNPQSSVATTSALVDLLARS